MSQRPGPVRTCLVCRRQAGQSELIRLAQIDGLAVFSRVAPGRGAWVHPDCTARLTLKTVSRALRTAVVRLPQATTGA